MSNRPIPISLYRRKAAQNARTQRIARIARQVREGTYYASGHEIAVKFLRRERAGAC